MESERYYVERISKTIVLLDRNKSNTTKPDRLMLRTLVSEYIRLNRDNKESVIWSKYTHKEKLLEKRLIRKIERHLTNLVSQ